MTPNLIIRIDETEDEDANEEYIEETNKDTIVIAAAKLVASGTVSKVKDIILCIVWYYLRIFSLFYHSSFEVEKYFDVHNHS